MFIKKVAIAILCCILLPQVVYASDISSIIESASNAYNVPPALIAALINNESGFNPNIFNDGDHVGLGQIGSTTVDPSIIQISCDQAGGPHLCDTSTCDPATGRCSTCTSTNGTACVQDERFNVEKNIRNTAEAFKSKADSVRGAGCNLNTEAGIKAALWAYNTGQRPVVYAITQVGNCSSYATIWQHARNSFTPSTPGGADGKIYPTAPNGGWSMTLAKLNNKDDSNPSSYVSKIYADYLRFGGTTPNETFRSITLSAASAQSAQPFSIEDIVLRKPNLQIQIPGLQFSSPDDRDRFISSGENESIFLNIPFLAEYLASIYRFAIATGSILAIIIIIVSGIQMMLPGNIVTKDQETTNHAKKRITGAITGLILAFGSYTILFVINPELVSLSPIQIQFVQPNEMTDTHGDYFGTGFVATYIPCNERSEQLSHISAQNYSGSANTQFLNINDCYFQSYYNEQRTIDKIVLHEGSKTVERTLNAWSRGYEESGGRWTISAHYVIDRAGTIYQVLGEEFEGIHAGSLNSGSIGIDLTTPEGCSQSSGYTFFNTCAFYTDAQYASLNLLIDDILSRYRFVKSVQTIVPHGRVAHSDPRNFDFSKLQLRNSDYWIEWVEPTTQISCTTDADCSNLSILNAAGYELSQPISQCLTEIGVCGAHTGRGFKR